MFLSVTTNNKLLPQPTKKQFAEVEKLFQTYLFYETLGKGREVTCSHCKKTFYVDSNMNYELATAYHNKEGVTCPHCGIRATMKNMGKAKTCKSLYEDMHICFIRKKSYNKIYIYCCYVNKNYDCRDYTVSPDYTVDKLYILTPGKAKAFKRDWWMNCYVQCNELGTCFKNKSNMFWLDALPLTVIGAECLNNSFLKYVYNSKYFEGLEFMDTDYEKINEKRNAIDILINSAENPLMEKCLKVNGFEYFAERAVKGDWSKRLIDWQAESLTKGFHATKNQLKFFQTVGQYPAIWQDFKELSLKKYKLPFEERKRLAEQHYGTKLFEFAYGNNLHYKKLEKYIKNQYFKNMGEHLLNLNTLKVYIDYFSMIKEMNFDLKCEEIIYPKDLKAKHDEVIEIYNNFKDQEKKEIRKDRLKATKKFEYNNGEYMMIAPKSTNDIIQEGQALHHCVASYAERHFSGKTTIMFLRNCLAPKERLCTIEYDEKRKEIVQSHGIRNRALYPDEKAFLQEWFDFVTKKQSKKLRKEVA